MATQICIRRGLKESRPLRLTHPTPLAERVRWPTHVLRHACVTRARLRRCRRMAREKDVTRVSFVGIVKVEEEKKRNSSGDLNECNSECVWMR